MLIINAKEKKGLRRAESLTAFSSCALRLLLIHTAHCGGVLQSRETEHYNVPAQAWPTLYLFKPRLLISAHLHGPRGRAVWAVRANTASLMGCCEPTSLLNKSDLFIPGCDTFLRVTLFRRYGLRRSTKYSVCRSGMPHLCHTLSLRALKESTLLVCCEDRQLSSDADCGEVGGPAVGFPTNSVGWCEGLMGGGFLSKSFIWNNTTAAQFLRRWLKIFKNKTNKKNLSLFRLTSKAWGFLDSQKSSACWRFEISHAEKA